MPDILVRGMEMPHIYDTVRFAMDVGSGKMFALNLYDETAEWHPVEELPPHGDLIDRDAFIAEIKKNDTYQNWLFRKMLEKQPVVVPAERSDADG